MAQDRPRHIVFDIGRVLIHYDPHLAFRELIPDDAERHFFLTEVCSHEWNLEQDRGRPWSEAEAEAIARHPDRAEEIRAFRKRWHRMVPHAYDGSVAIMLGLIEADVDVTMLTNFAADTFDEAMELFPFLKRPRAEQAGPGDLRPPCRELRPRSGQVPVHRRFGKKRRVCARRRLAGGSFRLSRGTRTRSRRARAARQNRVNIRQDKRHLARPAHPARTVTAI